MILYMKGISFEIKYFETEQKYCLVVYYKGVAQEARRCDTLNEALEMCGNYIKTRKVTNTTIKINIKHG